MSTVDALLAQSLLLHQPHVPSDVAGHDDLDYTRLTEDFLLWDEDGPALADERAAQSLTALCEAVVARCTIDQFADFLTDQVPQPRAAWILGCTLQLAGADDGARFWWQYAAGAGDIPAASYCLYLQHLARGDAYATALWQDQALAHSPEDTDTAGTDEQPPACQVMTADTSLSTLLRVLSRLSRTRTQAAQTVIEFVAASVKASYDQYPDLEFAVLGPQFVEQLVILAASLSDRPETAETGKCRCKACRALDQRPVHAQRVRASSRLRSPAVPSRTWRWRCVTAHTCSRVRTGRSNSVFSAKCSRSPGAQWPTRRAVTDRQGAVAVPCVTSGRAAPVKEVWLMRPPY